MGFDCREVRLEVEHLLSKTSDAGKGRGLSVVSSFHLTFLGHETELLNYGSPQYFHMMHHMIYYVQTFQKQNHCPCTSLYHTCLMKLTACCEGSDASAKFMNSELLYVI